MAYRSVSNFREKESRPTTPGEKIRRTYLWQINAKGEKVLVIDQEIDQQAEIDSYLEETKIENIVKRASIDPALAERLRQETGGGIQDFTEAPQTLAELQNIMLKAEQIWKDVPKEIKLKFENNIDKFISSYGTVEWAKNLGILKEEQKTKASTEETSTGEKKEAEK